MCSIRFAPALLRLTGLVHPSWAAAQAAVLPGVTVEATNSPLIEGSRSATITLPGWELPEENL